MYVIENYNFIENHNFTENHKSLWNNESTKDHFFFLTRGTVLKKMLYSLFSSVLVNPASVLILFEHNWFNQVNSLVTP